MADTMTDDLRDRVAAAARRARFSYNAAIQRDFEERVTDLVLPVVQAAITEARREAWEQGFNSVRDANPYAAGEHDTPARDDARAEIRELRATLAEAQRSGSGWGRKALNARARLAEIRALCDERDGCVTEHTRFLIREIRAVLDRPEAGRG